MGRRKEMRETQGASNERKVGRRKMKEGKREQVKRAEKYRKI